jgi:7-cyano-7-deazaguanine synthase in queuosine biosynthesis
MVNHFLSTIGPEWDKRVLDLPIRDEAEIGIFVSGGIDSAVLLRLLMESTTKKQFRCFTINNTKDNAVEHARDSILRAQDMFKLNDHSIDHQIVQPNKPFQADNLIMETAMANRPLHVYTATNHIPPSEWFKLPGDPPWRPWRNTMHKIISTPFLFLYKYHILSIIDIKGWQDIYDTSHTCTEQKDGHCNICWQCNELNWAKEQLA